MFQFYIIISAVIDLALTYFCGFIDNIYDVWKTIVIFPALFLACLIIHLAAFILYSLTANKNKKVDNINNSYRRFMLTSLKLYFHLVRVRIHVIGKDVIPNDKKFLFVCNHISVYDPLVEILCFADKELAFVSKKENLDIPFAGRYILKSGCIGLNREDNREAVKAINKAAENITNGVCAMGIYPEGWVNASGEGLLNFRNGAFKIAKKAKVPIIVATIENTRKINSNILKRHTDVFVRIVKKISYEEVEHLKTMEIGEKVFEIMSKSLKGEDTEKQN